MSNLIYINIILAILIVFFQRREPMTVWAWLLVLYFIPILGFLLYLVLGQDLHKKHMFKMKEIEDEMNYAIRKQEETIYKNEFEPRYIVGVTPFRALKNLLNSRTSSVKPMWQATSEILRFVVLSNLQATMFF